MHVFLHASVLYMDLYDMHAVKAAEVNYVRSVRVLSCCRLAGCLLC